MGALGGRRMPQPEWMEEVQHIGLDLLDWWNGNSRQRNVTASFLTRTGALKVYARRNALDRSVIEIATVSSLGGFNAVRSLYRTFCAEIPAIAECIVNPELDSLIERWGWDHAYLADTGAPTRINKAFQARFPRYAEAISPLAAIYAARGAARTWQP